MTQINETSTSSLNAPTSLLMERLIAEVWQKEYDRNNVMPTAQSILNRLNEIMKEENLSVDLPGLRRTQEIISDKRSLVRFRNDRSATEIQRLGNDWPSDDDDIAYLLELDRLRPGHMDHSFTRDEIDTALRLKKSFGWPDGFGNHRRQWRLVDPLDEHPTISGELAIITELSNIENKDLKPSDKWGKTDDMYSILMSKPWLDEEPIPNKKTTMSTGLKFIPVWWNDNITEFTEELSGCLQEVMRWIQDIAVDMNNGWSIREFGDPEELLEEYVSNMLSDLSADEISEMGGEEAIRADFDCGYGTTAETVQSFKLCIIEIARAFHALLRKVLEFHPNMTEVLNLGDMVYSGEREKFSLLDRYGSQYVYLARYSYECIWMALQALLHQLSIPGGDEIESNQLSQTAAHILDVCLNVDKWEDLDADLIVGGLDDQYVWDNWLNGSCADRVNPIPERETSADACRCWLHENGYAHASYRCSECSAIISVPDGNLIRKLRLGETSLLHVKQPAYIDLDIEAQYWDQDLMQLYREGTKTESKVGWIRNTSRSN